MIRVVLVSGLALLALWCGSATASAHAVLVSSDPAYGSTITHEPDRVSLTFDEPVTAAQDAVTISDADGQRVDTGGTTTADGGRTVQRHLRAGLPDGTYLLGWSLLSADGHLVSGSIVFGIGVPPDLCVSVAHPDPLVAALDTIVRLLTGLGYAGLALAVGIPVAARLIWPAGFRTRAVPQLIRIGAATNALTAVSIFAATPGRLAGSAGWGQPQVWAQAATTVLGAAALLRAAAAAVLAFAARKAAAAVGESTAPGRVSRSRLAQGPAADAQRPPGGSDIAYRADGIPGFWRSKKPR
ncbi:copper resistance protein CopC [Nocardia sp. NPDC020380]|uniref:copper resistance protein CopC n=1 Tax=Nocardia sp. NPDC020380 TaxID=3364309 RepID=UPI00378C6B8E